MLPISINPNAAMSFKTLVGIIDVNEPPAITPKRLAITRAEADPINTAKGLLLEPLIATVAN